MKKINNVLPRAVVFCAFMFLCLAAAPEKTVAQAGSTPPAGSYQQTCKNVKMYFNHILDAQCRTKSGAYKESRINYVFLCAGDVSNQNGVLACAKSADSAAFKNAVNKFSAASILVLGRDLKGTGINEPPKFGTDADGDEILKWIAVAYATGVGQQYLDGIKLNEAAEIIKTETAKQPSMIKELIASAYRQVFKREPTDAEYGKWFEAVKAKKEWYATIVGKLKSGK